MSTSGCCTADNLEPIEEDTDASPYFWKFSAEEKEAITKTHPKRAAELLVSKFLLFLDVYKHPEPTTSCSKFFLAIISPPQAVRKEFSRLWSNVMIKTADVMPDFLLPDPDAGKAYAKLCAMKRGVRTDQNSCSHEVSALKGQLAALQKKLKETVLQGREEAGNRHFINQEKDKEIAMLKRQLEKVGNQLEEKNYLLAKCKYEKSLLYDDYDRANKQILGNLRFGPSLYEEKNDEADAILAFYKYGITGVEMETSGKMLDTLASGGTEDFETKHAGAVNIPIV